MSESQTDTPSSSESSRFRLTERYADAQGPADKGEAIKSRIDHSGFLNRIKHIMANNKNKIDTDPLAQTLEDFISESENGDDTTIALHERTLISNILKLRDLTVVDVMVPRADITAVDISSSQQELLSLLAEKQCSRLPVFRDTLDEVVGTIHVKDVLAVLSQGKEVVIEELVRDVPIVSPALPVLDLILLMKQMRKHMVLVVDEYGGIDGLVTINDVVEIIIGEVDDEYDNIEDEPRITINEDGTVLADGRINVRVFEEEFGQHLTEEEREDVDTIGGLIFSLAGRVPARGEILPHPSGIIFEIIDADPRRVNKVMIKNIAQDRIQTGA